MLGLEPGPHSLEPGQQDSQEILRELILRKKQLLMGRLSSSADSEPESDAASLTPSEEGETCYYEMCCILYCTDGEHDDQPGIPAGPRRAVLHPQRGVGAGQRVALPRQRSRALAWQVGPQLGRPLPCCHSECSLLDIQSRAVSAYLFI